MDMTIQNPVIIRDKAAEEVKAIMSRKDIPENYFLRIGIKGAGCSGMGFLLGFDQEKPTDVKYEIAGIPVLIDKRHTMYLIGLEVDFYEGSDARGFTFINPNHEEADGKQEV